MPESTAKLQSFLTSDLPGTGGRIKLRYEDFCVQEIPLYRPSGQGDHIYVYVEKKGITTRDAMVRIARALGISSGQIGYAGLKDARAVTRQWLSIEHIDSNAFADLEIPDVTILEVAHHKNKLKINHLKGNRFIIRVRDLSVALDEAFARAQKIMAVLVERGVPNYYGAQRFGFRGDAAVLGDIGGGDGDVAGAVGVDGADDVHIHEA